MGELLSYEGYDHDELIDGVAYNMSPSANPKHQSVAMNISLILGNYLKGKKCQAMCDIDVVMDDDNHFRPDIVVICDDQYIKENYIDGPPTIIIEILSRSTMQIDLGRKKDKYAEFGVEYYLVVNPFDKSVTVFRNGAEGYEGIAHEYLESGVITLDGFEGLELKLEDIFYRVK
ncbi:MAG: Uma2 family endonuclease [Clostridiales bacterium]|jgi:Uma2 family endonuclease|nr:Uma2 family endonuclease [Clostridiales bacterium]